MIAKDLGLKEEELLIDFVLTDVSDERYDSYSKYEYTSIDVTHVKK